MTKSSLCDECKIDDYDDDADYGECPCDDCTNADYCDGWEARYCCTFCRWSGSEDCENCDSMDI